MRRAVLPLVGLLACLARPASAQVVAGTAFEDLDADGIQDPGERGLDAVQVVIHGAGAGLTGATSPDGTFAINAPGGGCRLVVLAPPQEPDPASGQVGGAFRRTPPDARTCLADQPGDPTDFTGILRLGMAPNLAERLQDPSLLYISLGDSIAAGVSVCFFEDTDYSPEIRTDVDCLATGSVTRDQRAVGGWHSEDLLTPRDGAQPNPQFIPNVVAADPDLVTISIGGNDFLDTEPGTAAAQAFPYAPADLQRSFQELANTRRTVQEILSTLASELPLAEIEINSVYDNQAGDCVTTDFHAVAPKVWNEMLRNTAWGQVRPLAVAEIEPELAHQDVLRSTCCGEERMICAFDGIHPVHLGTEFIRHALMESLGRIEVAPTGVTDGFDMGFLPLVGVLQPTTATVLADGAAITAPDEALVLDGVPAQVAPGAVLELSGFDLPSNIQPVRVIVGVRYRTSGTFADDAQLFDASVADFAPPQWTFTGWDTSTPLVGGSGTSGNLGTPSAINALPNVPNWRDVSAMVTKSPVDDGRTTGELTWPSPTVDDVRNLKVRLAVNAVGAADAGQVEWDGAWAWIYGVATPSGPPPGEVCPEGSGGALLLSREPGGVRMDWDPEPFAMTYRVHRGVIGAWDDAACDPASAGGCTPQLTWLEPWGADGGASWFVLVSAVNESGVGPLGFASDGTERLPGTTTCP